MASAAAYLVVRLEDGFGEVFPLQPGSRYTMGRAGTNRIVLKDDLCSREHAEIYHLDGRWWLRDLNSLNGTRVNGQTLEREYELSPGDEVSVVNMGGEGTESMDTRATEASVRGFWKAYRRHMGY